MVDTFTRPCPSHGIYHPMRGIFEIGVGPAGKVLDTAPILPVDAGDGYQSHRQGQL